MPKAKRKRQTGNPFEEFFNWRGRRFFPPNPPPEPEPVAHPLEIQMLTEMLKAGYKALAMKYHPDHEGGDAEKMTELNRLKKELGL